VGKINLNKGQSITLDKRDGGSVVASNGWTASNKDYDLKGLVRYHNGRQVYVGAANLDEVLATPEGAVRHHGDVTRPGERERITITWHPDVASVALSSYSARENGPGSFREYGVFVEIANGPQVVGITAQNANASRTSYTLCFGEIVFGQTPGELTVVNHEEYSKSGSERRVAYKGRKIKMDAGPEGQPKS
jgi:tellurium resistance protein TerD